jgi:DNA-binding MarR family transcriptional regulator
VSGFDLDWRESVGYLLRDASRLMLRVTAARLAAHGVTLAQYFLLRQLWEADGRTQREISKELDVPEPALAALLRTLEDGGFVRRERSDVDRRRAHVRVTPEGFAVRDALLAEGTAVVDGMLAGVPDAAVDEFRRTLKQIKANLLALEGAGRAARLTNRS